MKRFSKIFVILIAVMSCCFFTACGSKYKDLKMKVYDEDGSIMNSVSLLIDKDHPEESTMDLTIKFSGIDKKDIGAIMVYSNPIGLIKVENDDYRYGGKNCNITLVANKADKGELVVRHLSSNKKLTIPLVVDKKTEGIEVVNKNYIVDTSNTEKRNINLNEMFNLSSGATDLKMFKVIDKPAGVKLHNSYIEGDSYNGESLEYFTGIELESNEVAGIMEICPVTMMRGEVVEYSDEMMIHFVKTLKNENLVTSSSAYSLDYYDKNGDEQTLEIDVSEYEDYGKSQDKPIYLVQNTDSECEYLKSYIFDLKYKLEGEDPKKIEEYLSYYYLDENADCSNNFITSLIGKSQMAITANAYSSTVEEVTIWLHPKNTDSHEVNYVGEIKSVSTKLYVKGVVRPELIEISKDGEVLTSTKDNNGVSQYSIDVFNYYLSNNVDGDTSLGGRFDIHGINLDNYPVVEGMDGYRISIDPRLFYRDLANDNLYTDSNFSEKISTSQTTVTFNGDSLVISSNAHMLDFHLVNTKNKVKFYYEQTVGKMVSEIIKDPKGLYIIVKDNDRAGSNEELAFDIKSENEYPITTTINGNTFTHHKYLKNEIMPSAHVLVNRKEGVGSLDLFAGEITDVSLNVVYDYYYETGSSTVMESAETLYIDRNSSSVIDNYNKYFIHLNADSVKNGEGEVINSDVEFYVNVRPLSNDITNPLKVSSNMRINTSETGSQVKLNHHILTYLAIVFDGNTSVGKYEISFTQVGMSSPVKTLTAFVYDVVMNESDILLDMPINDKIFLNTSSFNEDYFDDDNLPTENLYIVASNTKYTLGVEFGAGIKDLVIDIDQDNTFSLMKKYTISSKIVKFDNEFIDLELSDNEVKEYFIYDSSNLLQFIKGTYRDTPKPNTFVELTVSIEVLRNKNMLTLEDEYDIIERKIYFYIYEEVKEIKFDKTIASVFADEYLGVYGKDDSNISLSLKLIGNKGENSSLVHYIHGETEWSYNDTHASKLDQTNDGISLKFKKIDTEINYTTTVTATISQFGKPITVACEVSVLKPIISENVILNSSSYINEGGEYYIYMKVGEDNAEVIRASNYSSLGTVSNPGLMWIVVDKYGIPVTTFNISTDGNSAEISSGSTPAGEYYLIIFAKDALKKAPNPSLSGYDNPRDFLMEAELPNEDQYKSAFFRLKIELADGSYNNPYLIHDAEDFMEIEGSSSCYKVMRNIDLSNIDDPVIESTSANIMTEGDDIVRIIGGITLNNSHKNLIQTFSGQIKNLSFQVKYDYQDVDNCDYLGVIGTNNGTLTNVFFESIGGKAIAIIKPNVNNGLDKLYLGGLVGYNKGTIIYTNAYRVGGNISIDLGGGIYFGGLVGLNEGTITGVLSDIVSGATPTVAAGAPIIDFSVSLGDQGAITKVDITGSALAIGGVAAHNKGVIEKTFVTGNINAPKADNVGGVVGINENATNEVKITLDNGANPTNVILSTGFVDQINNVVSTVVIHAYDNVGGIVGRNDGGSIKYANYQVVPTLDIMTKDKKQSAIIGNNNVGGIVGLSNYGVISFSSVYSYWWDYTALSTTFTLEDNITFADADIVGDTNVAGIVGSLVSNAELNGNATTKSKKIAVIMYSSVNAYVVSKDTISTTNAAPIANKGSDNKSVVYNAYFLGRVDGEDYTSDIENSYRAYVYIKWNEDVYVRLANADGNIQNIAYNETTPPSWPNVDFWSKLLIDKSNDYNSGYIYILKENNKPLFDIAPTELHSTVKSNYRLESSESKLLVLNYYDFNNPNISASKLNDLNIKFNRHSLLTFVDFTFAPKMSSLRLYVRSLNPNVVSIGAEGYINVNSTGTAVIEFIPVLNPSIKDSITIEVVLPMGEYYVSNNLNASAEEMNNLSISLAKGKSTLLYSNTKGYKTVTEQDQYGKDISVTYSYATESNPHLRVDFKVADSVVDNMTSGTQITNYIRFSGLDSGYIPNGSTSAVINISNKLPFTVQALDAFPGASFEIIVTPYTKISYQKDTEEKEYSVFYYGDKHTSNALNSEDKLRDDIVQSEFDVGIGVGASDISLNHSEIILYPNDRTMITAYIKTDMPLTDIEVKEYFRVLLHSQHELVGNYNHNSMLELIENNDPVDGIQKVKYELTIANYLSQFKESVDLEVEFSIGEGINQVTRSVIFTVLPQRIEKIDIQTYTELTKGEAPNVEYVLEKGNMIKPASPDNPRGAWALIDMVPINGYFDYLEIRDITGSELIKFVQYAGHRDTAQAVQTTADGLGIRIDKISGKDTLFVYMQIEGSYTTKIHTLEVSAYIEEEINAIYRETIDIQAKMMPEIKAEYILPNGDVLLISDENKSETKFNLALGTDAEFRISIKDATTPLMHEFKSGEDLYEFVYDQGDFYKLKFKETTVDWNKVGEEVSLDLYVHAEEDNGRYEETRITLTFTLAKYIVHSISASPSVNGSVYGLFNRITPLEFYIGAKDISYAGRSSNNSEYHYDDIDTDTNLEDIYDVLGAINPTDITTLSNFLSVRGENDRVVDISKDNDIVDISMEVVPGYTSERRMEMVVRSEMGEYKFTGDERLILDLTNILNGKTYADFWISKKLNINVEGSATQKSAVEYNLSFVPQSSAIEPIVITTPEEFLKMASGDLYYTLGADIELEDYSPMNIVVKEFDGNGHTITINRLSELTDASARVGLFQEIPDGMLVKNLTVMYENIGSTNSYLDLTTNTGVNFTDISFGGLAAVNNGVITNCKVEGNVYLSASVLTNRGDVINIGGMVSANSQSGYITNSTSSLKINSLSNIGGFVYSNAGKIVSSGNKNGKINTYDRKVTANIEAQAAGFAVQNTGNISMSYVELDKANVMNTKNVSAGFVLTNSGNIGDSYTIIEYVDWTTNSNFFSGFVDMNSGRIERSYSYVNGGNRPNNYIYMFYRTSKNTDMKDGFINCIEIVNEENYSSDIVYVKYDDAKQKFVDNNFNFGGDYNVNNGSVWFFESNTPKLVSTRESVQGVNRPGLTKENGYYGNIEIFKKVTVETDSSTETRYVRYLSNYGSRENPYIIHDLDSWNRYVVEESIQGINTGYYRIVKDLDFSSLGDNPTTSKIIFGGNIQGNNMTFKNIMLRSSEALESIGLFQSMKSLDGSVDRAVRNLTLTTSSVWATKTEAVGLLAGIIEDYRLYNIHINAPNVTMVGGNAVGGLAGVVRGKIDIEDISSNVSVNSTRVTTTNPYYIYKSVNNKETASANLKNVYYAGSVIGIVDGYNEFDNYSVNDNRIINGSRNVNYYQLRNIRVDGAVVVVGDIVGTAIGFVGERVELDNLTINLTGGSVHGSRYGSMAIGENRGIVHNVTVSSTVEKLFANTVNTTAGVVGLNVGGLIRDTKVLGAYISNMERGATVGGIVGRNIGGTVNNVTFGADSNMTTEIDGYYVGGIIGAEYTGAIFISNTVGKDALNASCKNSNIVPTGNVIYTDKGNTLKKYHNIMVGNKAVEYVVTNLNKYYDYKAYTTGEETYNPVSDKKVFGLAVGLTCENNKFIYYDKIGDNNDYNIVMSYDYDETWLATPDYTGDNTSTAKVNNVKLSADANGNLQILLSPEGTHSHTACEQCYLCIDPYCSGTATEKCTEHVLPTKTISEVVILTVDELEMKNILLFTRGAIVGSVNGWDKVNAQYDYTSCIIINFEAASTT